MLTEKLLSQRRNDIYLDLMIEQGYPSELAARLACEQAKQTLTPAHSDECRLVPNEFVRCALFRVANPSAERKYLDAKPLHVQAARFGTITYTGQELRQDDRQVFLEALFLERSTPGFALIKPRKFCRALKWGDSNEALERLKKCLIRMKATALSIAVPRFPKPVAVSLIQRIEEHATGEIAVYFDDEIRTLFEGQYFTRIVLDFQANLNKRANLASWLLGFYASHREPQAMQVAELQMLSGSGASAKEFTRMLKQALEQLKGVGFLTDFSVDKALVHVTRS